MQTITAHVSVPVNKRDIDWLKSALQSAIELEHSTLPLYLATMFSLEVQNYTTYNLIRSVVMEEMVHMAIACNSLAALGGKPQIKNLSPKFPGYGLPGGAEPDLEAVVAKLSPDQVKNFMRLESPAFLLPAKYKDETYPTIGTLYNAIKEAIHQNATEVRDLVKKVSAAPPNTYANQVGDNIGFTTIVYQAGVDPVDQLCAGIDEIVEQGEGSQSHDLHAGSGSEHEASHYARFAEIYYGARFQTPTPSVTLTPKTEPQFFKGYPIPWPVVTNVLTIPTDGYKKILALDSNQEMVEKVLQKFDDIYTDIMNDLEAMWNGPAAKSWPTFGDAVSKMTDLRVLSCFYIMRHQIPTDIVAKLETLYPQEYTFLKKYTDLSASVFYGPRFINNNSDQ